MPRCAISLTRAQRWRHTLHLEDVEGRLALAHKNPERALDLAESELAAARKSRSRKIEARALELRGRSLLVLDQREQAETTLKAALRAVEAIGYPPVRWRVLALLGELARREGVTSRAQELLSRSRGVIDEVAAKSPQDGLARSLAGLGERLAEDPEALY